MTEPCTHCGHYHFGPCPRIKAVEYWPNGTVKKVEYHDMPLLAHHVKTLSDEQSKDTPKEIPGKREWFEGKLLEVKDARRQGWWRFHEHYDRDGYCDNPARGY